MITESYYGVVRKEESLNRLILAIGGGTVTEIPEAKSYYTMLNGYTSVDNIWFEEGDLLKITFEYEDKGGFGAAVMKSYPCRFGMKPKSITLCDKRLDYRYTDKGYEFPSKYRRIQINSDRRFAE